MQARVNMETLGADGQVHVGGGQVQTFTPPGGPGVRVDTFVTTGLTPSPQYDALLAKVVVHRRDAALPGLLRQAATALSEFQIAGVSTNLAFLQALLHHPDVQHYELSTHWLDERLPELVTQAAEYDDVSASTQAPTSSGPSPLPDATPGTERLTAPTTGMLVAYDVHPGQRVRRGECLAVVEAMKIEFQIEAPRDGQVVACHLTAGSSVTLGQPLLDLAADEGADDAVAAEEERDLDALPASYADWQRRLRATTDEARPLPWKSGTRRAN
ncbi:hypothetical protein MSS93_15275 [Deinococcus radiodurans]|nr:hypothetical protein MSS93_15275 [Deinococcus radiodurans]